MVENSELITVYRQIGGMMEAGVDILRITRVLRAQTENPRLLEVYDAIDHDLTMGQSLAEAMAHAPDVFSPFIVSLVQQGEDRNDLAGAFLKSADYLQKEEEVAHEILSHNAQRDRQSRVAGAGSDGSWPEAPIGTGPAAAPLSVIALDGLIERLQTLGMRALTTCAGLLLALAVVWWSAEMGLLERRWLNVTLSCVAALFIATAGAWAQRRGEIERRRESRCSFCGQPSTESTSLQRAPRSSGAAICARCAAIVARRYSSEVDPGNNPDADSTANNGSATQTTPDATSDNNTASASDGSANGKTAPSASRDGEGNATRAKGRGAHRVAATPVVEEDYD